MVISIFGLGYVGIVTSCCLAKMGHKIIGVDVDLEKVNIINEQKSNTVEKDVDELLKSAKEKTLFTATSNVDDAILNSDISIVCVGTPSKTDGSIDLKYVEAVCSDIGKALKLKNKKHILVFRSTMIPGSMRCIVMNILEQASGLICNKDFSVVFNPEFLREGTAVSDFFNPPKTVIGSDCEKSAKFVMEIYKDLPQEKIITSLENAEMVKYVDNTYHALKIGFANEIGRICKGMNIDSREVMDIFMKDTKLNISKAYLKPGFAFGGSCLPKDLRAITHMAKTMNVEVPLLNSILESNKVHVTTTIKRIESFNKNKIGIAGVSFKEGTDDLRESPMLEVIKSLLSNNYELKIYDKNVSIEALMNESKRLAFGDSYDISKMMANSLDELMGFSELIVIGNKSNEFEGIINKSDKTYLIYDLVGLGVNKYEYDKYKGICW